MLKTVFTIGLISLGFALLFVMHLLEKRGLNRRRSIASQLAAAIVSVALVTVGAVSVLRFAQLAQQAALQDTGAQPPG
ncbi:hypothetical protein DWF00_13270 [Bosea caraganae]|uniref:Uncharacterized protein n=1 Tax=Bosea caraganae TaxID=2763117 RepID=A0A370L1B1_9HYPH|nr:hypothetical protein [Bosea caraganae]RDJ21285.1 hypothetical protein DWE98_21435 [Bosea caraganae]RDJ26425.1 hypothetical protein DWF00_13270 [Bosea caraganae]